MISSYNCYHSTCVNFKYYFSIFYFQLYLPHAGHDPQVKRCFFKQNLHVNKLNLESFLSLVFHVGEVNLFFLYNCCPIRPTLSVSLFRSSDTPSCALSEERQIYTTLSSVKVFSESNFSCTLSYPIPYTILSHNKLPKQSAVLKNQQNIHPLIENV